MSPKTNVKATIYIVRHGECMGNVLQAAIDPQTDVLTDVGKEQAALLGKHLQDVPFTRIYASDFPRTKETAEIIAKQSRTSKAKEVEMEIRIRERDYSGIIGKTAAEAVSILTDKMRKGERYLFCEMPNSETVEQFEGRLTNFFSDLVKECRQSQLDEETVLLSSHALTIQRLMVLLNSRSHELGIQKWTRNLFSEKMMKNTTYHQIILDIPRDGSEVTGCVAEAHYREHVCGDVKTALKPKDVQDSNNYTFLEDKSLASFEDEANHYCSPV